MDENTYVDASPLSDDWGLKRATNWKLTFCWKPKKCFLSNIPLWGKFAYRGTYTITGPGEPYIDYYWIGKQEFLLWQLGVKV